MTTYTMTDRSFGAGVPAQGSDSFVALQEGLITGEYPTQFVEDIPAANNQTLAAYTVVGKDGSGNIVPAVYDATYASSGVRPIGILIEPITTPSSGAVKAARVLRSACLNPAKLVWDASFDTAAKKQNAFQGAPSPTQIVIRGITRVTPVLP